MLDYLAEREVGLRLLSCAEDRRGLERARRSFLGLDVKLLKVGPIDAQGNVHGIFADLLSKCLDPNGVVAFVEVIVQVHFPAGVKVDSVAAPGTSQHIAMLALDVAEYGNASARRILANHGWFQTVKSDLPHFTYLGRKEKDLPALGLRSVTIGNQVFWIPDTTGK